MKKLIVIVSIIFFIASCHKSKKNNDLKAVKTWSTTGELKVPESVMYDSQRNCLYVSNINGRPTEKNMKGFIAKLSPEGKILKLKWATGMSAPKGMGIKGNTLYVTDIDRIHVIDMKSGKIKQTVVEPEAKFLNDIAICSAGNVFISDMASGKIYVLKNNMLKEFIDLKKFNGSNGMLRKETDLLVGTKSGIVKVDLNTKKASLLVAVKNFGMIDGLKTYNDTSFITSNWAGKTQIIDLYGNITVLLDTTQTKIQSADIEYIASKKLLLIPTFFNNKVVAYTLK